MNDTIESVLDTTLIVVADLAASYLPELCYLAGAAFVLFGWVGWRQERRWPASAKALTDGIYRLTRHPEYVGVLLIAFGLFIRLTTLPLLSIWPLLILLYSSVARDSFAPERGFPDALRAYRDQAGALLARFRSRFR